MNLQDKIISLSEYKLGFNIYSGHTIINITFPKEWSVIKPENDEITFAQDEVNTDVYFYSAPITFDMKHIFDSIESTIEFNKEMEKKIALFQEKQKELQSIFIDESYETLQTLTFSFKKKRKNVKNEIKETTKEDIKNENNVTHKQTTIVNNNEIEEMSVDEIKKLSKKSKQEKSKRQNKISKHTQNLEVLPGEEVCEDIIISNSDLNNGIY